MIRMPICQIRLTKPMPDGALFSWATLTAHQD
jgi:hypothetical protein